MQATLSRAPAMSQAPHTARKTAAARPMASATGRRCVAVAASAAPGLRRRHAPLTPLATLQTSPALGGNLRSTSASPSSNALTRPVALRRGRPGRAAAGVVVQANLFARLSRVVRSAINNFVGGFEDPERLLDRVVEEMNEDLVKMRQVGGRRVPQGGRGTCCA